VARLPIMAPLHSESEYKEVTKNSLQAAEAIKTKTVAMKSLMLSIYYRGEVERKNFYLFFFFGPQKPPNLDAKRIEFYLTKMNG
jgi:hypothetical protein